MRTRLTFLFILCLLFTVTNSARANDYNDAGQVLGSRHYGYYHPSVGVMPTFSWLLMSPPPGISVSNAYTLGLGLNIPVSPYFATEIEGAYTPDARWVDRRGLIATPYGPTYAYRDFSMWSLGGNLKIYLTRYGFRPYLGGGLAARYYDGKSLPGQPGYTRWTGDVQGFVGFDWEVTPGVSFGPRAAYVCPLINTIGYYNSPALYYAPGPYGADRDIINSSYGKLSVNATISF